ncbi:MAG: SUMF1/EgtB/PvdO family nonheme iron enzyme [Dehalococcoidia bacterium]|nr:SUMF1/EgtB/PvdO family nonheme iron enzyme [Dehalococcoidia bacterium]
MSGKQRVLRGGSWRSPAEYCRSTNRTCNGPGSARASIGFRVARRLEN